jgi:hypothetical protein
MEVNIFWAITRAGMSVKTSIVKEVASPRATAIGIPSKSDIKSKENNIAVIISAAPSLPYHS